MITDNQNDGILLLVDGKEAFQRIIQRIKSAQETIYINMFIWRDDRIGNTISNELIQAADRGVQIKIIKDKLGEVYEKAEEKKQSFFNKKFSLGMWVKSVAVDLMYPMNGKAKSRKQRSNDLIDKLLTHSNVHVSYEIVRKDHSKYYIFDEKIIIMGGMNIEDKSIYTDVEGRKYNDYMIEISGSAHVDKFRRRLFEGEKFDESASLEFIFNVKRNDEKFFEAKSRILHFLSLAKESVDILMAYIGDKDMREKIIELSNRGVCINIILPSKANIQHDLNMKELKRIMEKTANKVNVHLSNNMLHAKFIRIDHQIVTFGSVNLNKYAMKKLSELNVLIRDYEAGFNEKLEASIQKNLSESKRISTGSEIRYNSLRALIEQLV